MSRNYRTIGSNEMTVHYISWRTKQSNKIVYTHIGNSGIQSRSRNLRYNLCNKLSLIKYKPKKRVVIQTL